jgi:hypothetical protein
VVVAITLALFPSSTLRKLIVVWFPCPHLLVTFLLLTISIFAYIAQSNSPTVFPAFLCVQLHFLGAFNHPISLLDPPPSFYLAKFRIRSAILFFFHIRLNPEKVTWVLVNPMVLKTSSKKLWCPSVSIPIARWILEVRTIVLQSVLSFGQYLMILLFMALFFCECI